MTKSFAVAKLKEFAINNHFAFDNEQSMAFGNAAGYNLTVGQNYQTGCCIIFMNLEGPTGAVTQQMFSNIKNETQKINKAIVSGNGAVAFEVTAAAVSAKGSFDNLQTALNSLIPYLQARGLGNSCYGCNVNKNTASYVYSGNALQLCDNCSVSVANNIAEKQAEHTAKSEKIMFGAVGALLGSLIGVAAIVIIGQLGYVAAISGFLLAICTLKGYEMFAGKMTKKGIIISLAIMIAMTLFGNHLDWAIFVARELGINVFDAFSLVSSIADETSYMANLGMIALFAVIGSVGSIIAAFKAQGAKLALVRLQNR